MTNQVVENFIGCFDNVVSQKECKEYIQFFEYEHALQRTQDRSHENISKLTKGDTSWYEYYDSITEQSPEFTFIVPHHLFVPLKIKIMECFKLYATKWDSLINDNQRYMLSPGIKIQKTNPGEGYHIWHYENPSVESSTRRAVYTLYLNDNFDAGETEFLYMQSRVKPQTGTVCIFPSGFTHTHRGNPPIGNSKYIITGWIELVSE